MHTTTTPTGPEGAGYKARLARRGVSRPEPMPTLNELRRKAGEEPYGSPIR